MKIEFSPTLKKLEKNVEMLPQLISAISEFKRLPEMISCKKSQEKPIHTSIGLPRCHFKQSSCSGEPLTPSVAALRAGRGDSEDPSCSVLRDVSHYQPDKHLQKELGQVQGHLGDGQGHLCAALREAERAGVFL